MVAVPAPEIHEINSVPFVFGLEWFAVIGPDAQQEALKLAHKYKASHVSVASKFCASVGMANISAKNVGNKKLYCAAQLVAGQLPAGTIALLVPINHKTWWLLAVHEGAVIARTDFLCTDRSQALSVIDDLHQSYPSLEVVDGLYKEIPLLQYLTAGYEHAALQPVPTLVLMVVAYWRLFAGLAAVVLASLYFVLNSDSRAANAPNYDAEALQSNALAWEQAVNEAANKHWVHGVEGTISMLQNLYALPVSIGGWALVSAECLPDQSKWLCTSSYARRHVSASNVTFMHNAPHNWRVEFTPLDQAKLHWVSDSGAKQLSTVALNGQEQNEQSLFSSLQKIKPAFASIHISVPQLLPVNTPLDSNGNPLPKPQGLPVFKQRVMEIKSPLRSASLLLSHSEHIAWNRAFLSVLPITKPGLLDSRVSLALQGVLYEKG